MRYKLVVEHLPMYMVAGLIPSTGKKCVWLEDEAQV